VGEEGVLRADNGLTVDHPIRLELWKQGQLVETEQVDNALAYGEQVDAFSDTITNGAPFPVPGEVGVANQRLLDAAYESIDTGHTIAIAAQ
jgi:1,5-anhydro-D-fructose reductase (1,5-anhydro-D-mannitol-forming)